MIWNLLLSPQMLKCRSWSLLDFQSMLVLISSNQTKETFNPSQEILKVFPVPFLRHSKCHTRLGDIVGTRTVVGAIVNHVVSVRTVSTRKREGRSILGCSFKWFCEYLLWYFWLWLGKGITIEILQICPIFALPLFSLVMVWASSPFSAFSFGFGNDGFGLSF